MKLTIHPDYEQLRDYIRTIPERFDRTGEVLHAGRNTVRTWEVEGERWVVKRYQRPNLLNRLVYTFLRKDKAHRSFEVASRFRALNIDTPAEIAALHIRRGGLFETGYFVSGYAEGQPLSQALVDENFLERDAEGRRPVDLFVRFAAELHVKGVDHLDFSENNVLCSRRADGEYRFALIDTNRMRFHRRPLSRRASLWNLRRLTWQVDAYLYVLCRYARVRGWDTLQTVARGVRYRVPFANKYHRKQRLKRLLGLIPR